MLQWLFKIKPASAPPPEQAASPKDSAPAGAAQPNTLAQAVQLVSRAVAINPLDPVAHCSLGKIYLEMNRIEEAKACFAEALTLKPDYAEAHYKLGNAARIQGELDEALACYQRAKSFNPDYAEAHNNEGVVYQERSQWNEAIASYRRALLINPKLVDAHYNLGLSLFFQGDSSDALACFRKAIFLNPDFAGAHNAEGLVHRERAHWNEAIAAHQRALSIDPGLAEAHDSLGTIFQHQNRLGDAIACFRKAVSIRPDFASAYSNLGMALALLGRHDEAVAAFRRALSISPDLMLAHSNLLFHLSHDPGVTPEEVFAEHRAFGDRFEGPFRGRWLHHRNLPDPGRTLRVGFVSADLRTHAVSSFVEPLWAALDSGQVEIWAYSNHLLEDDVTLRLKGLAHRWRKVAVMSDEELAVQVRKDEIDILFDLSGHTAGHRLLAFARKPAPIQVSWIGNPNTTGLNAIDYYLADRFSAPPGLLDSLFTEKIVRLPSRALFQPLDRAPAVNGLPALESGVLTFGSFSRSDKLAERVVALWSRVLNAVPESRMLLGGLSDASRQEDLVEQFARNGVDRGRVVFHPRVGMREYLALHQQVDLILDTFPFCGLTTSCHAAWMGVPVLTLAGKTMASRVGLFVNSNIGLPEFITESEDAFVTQAVRWSRRLPELAALRASLRPRVLASPLCQTQAFARWLELALRTMWRRWCEEKPPESFGINP